MNFISLFVRKNWARREYTLIYVFVLKAARFKVASGTHDEPLKQVICFVIKNSLISSTCS